MAKKVINGNFSVTVYREGKFVTVGAKDGAFDFTKEEVADIEAVHGKDGLRNPVNETPAGEGGSGKSEDEIKAETQGVVKGLLGDKANLNNDGAIKMDVLNDALKLAGLPKVSAADRDAIVAALTGDL